MFKGQNGVTLVALVITIIVLLILAGVSLTVLFSPDGLLNKAQKAKNDTGASVANEQAQLDTVFTYFNNAVADGHISE